MNYAFLALLGLTVSLTTLAMELRGDDLFKIQPQGTTEDHAATPGATATKKDESAVQAFSSIGDYINASYGVTQ